MRLLISLMNRLIFIYLRITLTSSSSMRLDNNQAFAVII